METIQQTTPPEETRERYRLARIEHYLREAEGCFQMGRYSAAARVVKRVTDIEPGNSDAQSLMTRIKDQISVLRNRNGNGHSANAPTTTREKGKTVLVVDQDERVLVNLTQKLRKFGLRTVSALNCDEASETVASITPDLVISEVNFANGPEGFNLFSSIRSQNNTKHTPFLFVATRIDRETLIAGKRLGVDDFIFKPVDSDVVAASVMNCLARLRREQPLS